MPMPEHCSNCDKPRPEGRPCKCESREKERIDGDFFWVRLGKGWSIANQDEQGGWWLFGYDFTDSGIDSFDELGPKVEIPDEIRKRVE